jgi:hypothetical protein
VSGWGPRVGGFVDCTGPNLRSRAAHRDTQHRDEMDPMNFPRARGDNRQGQRVALTARLDATAIPLLKGYVAQRFRWTLQLRHARDVACKRHEGLPLALLTWAPSLFVACIYPDAGTSEERPKFRNLMHSGGSKTMTTLLDQYGTNYSATQDEEMSLEAYLDLCKENPAAYSTAAERMLAAIGAPELVDTRNDPGSPASSATVSSAMLPIDQPSGLFEDHNIPRRYL